MLEEKPGCVALDLDGTLYHAGSAVAGASGAVAALRRAGYALRFATNTFATPPAAIRERLAKFGIPVEPEELLTPRESLARFIAAKSGARIHSFIRLDIRDSLPFLPPQAEGEVDFVVVGDADPLWSYAAFDALLGYLAAGAELVATSASRSYTARDGRLHLDTGALVALLESASGRAAKILGKPSAEFGALVASSACVELERLLFVGDDPAVDMATARAVGARSVLVLTGKGLTAPRDPAPDLVIPSIAELPRVLGELPEKA
jgi:HAD superfamily hydrolase (TIGR01450 family)